MRKIIFALLLVCNYSTAQTVTSLIKLDDSWKIDNKTKIGTSVRISATNQHPFPYCFATAATMLYDQTVCSLNNAKQCKNPQTSFLAISAAGQGFKELNKLNPNAGGSPIKSLNYLLNTGRVNESDCGYNNIFNDTGLYKLTYELRTLHEKYKKYEARAPYLSGYFKYEFTKTIKQLSSELDQQTIDELLSDYYDLEKITAKTLLNAKCFKPQEIDNKFQIKFTRVDSKDLKQAQLQIEKLLRQKKPIIVNFCTSLNKNNECGNQTLHSLIIISQAKAVHKITEDKRTVYWLVNSWAEEWQQQNSDGWVYADKLLEALVGEIIWLELK